MLNDQQPVSKETNNHSPTQLLRFAEVQKLTGLSRTAIYTLAREKHFPAPLKISIRSSAWVSSEVSEWLQNKIAERDATSK